MHFKVSGSSASAYLRILKADRGREKLQRVGGRVKKRDKQQCYKGSDGHIRAYQEGLGVIKTGVACGS